MIEVHMTLEARFHKDIDFLKKTFDFAKNDLRKRYAGSSIGSYWAFIQTVTMVLIYWIVFQYGLRTGGVDGIPFLPWFISGMMPWLLFSDAINSSINCMSEYSYIVKKVVFNISIIPACKIMVCLMIYSFFLLVVFLVVLLHGFFTGWYILQVLFFLLADIVLAIPLAYASCVVSVFFKDFGQITSIVLNMLMWATPIVWDISIIPKSLRWIFKANPMNFIVSGFRNSLIYGIPVWNDLSYLFYFISIVCFLWAICLPFYRRLTPHLADVL